jgi:hypothetical protein
MWEELTTRFGLSVGPATGNHHRIAAYYQIYPFSHRTACGHFDPRLRWTVGRPTVDFTGYPIVGRHPGRQPQ